MNGDGAGSEARGCWDVDEVISGGEASEAEISGGVATGSAEQDSCIGLKLDGGPAHGRASGFDDVAADGEILCQRRSRNREQESGDSLEFRKHPLDLMRHG